MRTDIRCRQCGRSFGAEVVQDQFRGACPGCVAAFALQDEPILSPGSPISPGPAPLQPGSVFRGLEIQSLVGQGGMGVVYKARHPGLDRIVALKILSPALASEPEFAARFGREAKVLAALNHPHIVHVFDSGREGDLFFLVMEFVDGVSLRELMRQGVSPQEALRIVPQICEALEYAHTQGVVHRDIKPENILVDPGGGVKIADFGLAKMSSLAQSVGMTRSNVVIGTPHYMAPEQLESLKETDHRADIFSLGVVFYEMLTGQLPIGRFEPPSARQGVDARLDPIVLRAMEPKPERRYQRASEVKTAVEKVNSGALAGEDRPAGTPTSTPEDDAPLYWIDFIAAGLVIVAAVILEISQFFDKGDTQSTLVRLGLFPLVLGAFGLGAVTWDAARSKTPKRLYWVFGVPIVLAIGLCINVPDALKDFRSLMFFLLIFYAAYGALYALMRWVHHAPLTGGHLDLGVAQLARRIRWRKARGRLKQRWPGELPKKDVKKGESD